MVEQIEKLRAELNFLIFPNERLLCDREIKVRLSWPAHDADAGGTEIRSISDLGERTCARIGQIRKLRDVKEPGNSQIAHFAESVLNASFGCDLIVGDSRTQLRPAHAFFSRTAAWHAVDASAAAIE